MINGKLGNFYKYLLPEKIKKLIFQMMIESIEMILKHWALKLKFRNIL